jgi:hypothetical protein
MKSLLFVTLCIAVVFGNNNTSTTKCSYVASDGSVYDLSPLKKTSGTPYSFVDKEGNSFFFNICGDLRGIDAGICPPDASVCYLPKGASMGINAGTSSFALYSDGAHVGSGLEVVYGKGAECPKSKIPIKTTFEFSCDTDAHHDNIQISKFTSAADGCYFVFELTSRDGCPLSIQEPQIIGEESESLSVAPFSTFLFLFVLASCMLCCCACCARRRQHQKKKQQHEMEMLQYSNDLWIPQQETPAPQFSSPYFFYPQVPVQVVDMEQQSLISDEHVARQLQAQYDAELRQ